MHGAFSGGPTGSRNGAYRHGRSTREAKALSKHFREMAEDAEVFLATSLDAAGLGRKIPVVYRRRTHIKKARAAAKKARTAAAKAKGEQQ